MELCNGHNSAHPEYKKQKPQPSTHVITLHKDKMATFLSVFAPIPEDNIVIKKTVEIGIINLLLAPSRIFITMQIHVNDQDLVHNIQTGSMTFKCR